MSNPVIKEIYPLNFQWPTLEPFLFCVHHYDHYPEGNSQLEIDPKHFVGRQMGSDFQLKDGFRLYHGDKIPGFPVHPHRGFETITIVRKGYADHADSLGAAGRYGEGDVQWMTAGRGIQHSEMFPLLNTDKGNTLELFQIWLNLPKKNKMTAPYFKMFWNEKIPKLKLNNNSVELTLIAGKYKSDTALTPPPESWAADLNNEVLIYLVKLQPNSNFELPASAEVASRMIYFFEGENLKINEVTIPKSSAIHIDSQKTVHLFANEKSIEVLVLQAIPIGEPVVQHGPFVMNTKEEIMQTFNDYNRTRFGGWSWPRADMVHGNKSERFAKYPNGKLEKPNELA